MADFKKAFENTSSHEGGWVNDPDDSGGETYKGIARNIWPKWEGWEIVDEFKIYKNSLGTMETHAVLQKMVYDFYFVNFWKPIEGYNIQNQQIAETIYDFGVNAGPGTSKALAKAANGDSYDFTNTDIKTFNMAFALAKIARYIYICKKQPVKRKYLYNWISRSLSEMK